MYYTKVLIFIIYRLLEHIIRTPEGSSKGCAFIKLQTTQQAMNAIQQMHGSQTMPVSTIISRLL